MTELSLASTEQSPNSPTLEQLGNGIYELVAPGTEPRVYSVEADLGADSKILLGCKIDEDPSESEIIVSRYVVGEKGLARQTYRWARAFPDSKERQSFQSVDPAARDIRSSHKGFSPADEENLIAAVSAAQKALQANG